MEDADSLAPRFRPLRREAPFGWDTEGDRNAQAAGARAFRQRGRWQCGRVVVVVAGGAVVALNVWLPAFDGRILVLVAAVAAGVGAELACRVRRDAAAARLRRTDETAGFPVPPDLAGRLGDAAEPLLALHGWYALPDGELEPGARRVLRTYARDLRAVDARVFADLHRARVSWVDGDAAAWRRDSEAAIGSARRAHTIYADVRSRTALPPPDTGAAPPA